MIIERSTAIIPGVTVGTTAAASTGFNNKNFAGGMVYVPAGSSITSLAWYGSSDGILFYPIYDGAGNAVTSTVAASECCLIPAACFASAFLKAVDAAGGTISVSLKA
jgi:hypothetical protein